MSLGISAASLSEAYKESDKFRINPIADREYRILHNDGMTLKIVQDNFYDRVINILDGRRIKLEKQAEILHDFYGDRLLAKELFQQYVSYKQKTGGLANLLSLGIISANIYSRVMKNSIFMGKLGTLGSIIALHYAGRYLSNNHLESQIHRPWKIHTYRMSQGLGPTNIPSNGHEEIITSPLRFINLQFTTNELLFGTYKKYVPSSTDIRYPINVDVFPYQPEAEDMHKLQTFHYEKYKRAEKVEPEDDGKFIQISAEDHMKYQKEGKIGSVPYPLHEEMYKSFLIRGSLTLWGPEHVRKKVAFEATKFEELYKDTVVEDNPYYNNSLFADNLADLPSYAQDYEKVVNLTKERIDLLSKYNIHKLH